ncbi:ADP-ribosylglycohydrolase family protein [Cohnella silvisoli]|uniref:ADP-ribosylglycohydrolase family protein n=1 Tax=Cohnella silvisoli TaxID=2873699 RepID=A0ABV1KW24_9BACL|nr:ADP-ribosylglycohydrolase family protein [Cohnella silvisoli]MCD9023706.1 ADP-ribosylglycohydrolase family protein [Cohnella silvisoli]
MAGWAPLKQLLRDELKQKRLDGCELPGWDERVETVDEEDESALLALWKEMYAAVPAAGPDTNQPSDLAGIRALRPDGPRSLPVSHTEEEWQDRFLGAWLGRCVGCALGKPIETPDFMQGSHGRPGWRNVQLWFEGADAWPIIGYTPKDSRAAEQYGLALAPYGLRSTREDIKYMETDDDIRYTVLGLIMLEEKGMDFDSWDIGKLWHRNLTYQQVCTAETQAYLNFTQLTAHLGEKKPEDWETKGKPWVATHLNPYREWIGAQIRADGWGYGAAGRPQLAAELAWRDASFSHVKNGIYGEMFVAAMVSAAFVESDAEKLVDIGLSEIPANSVLAQDVRQAVDIAKTAGSQTELADRLWQAFGHYDGVHTNNNAALVAASLIYARGDFEIAVTTSVLGGWDTDCNGATVGSIMGAMLGGSRLPASWTAPLNDLLYAELPAFHPIRISEAAERTYRVFDRYRNNA